MLQFSSGQCNHQICLNRLTSKEIKLNKSTPEATCSVAHSATLKATPNFVKIAIFFYSQIEFIHLPQKPIRMEFKLASEIGRDEILGRLQ